MSALPSVIELGPAEEAERLWLGSLEAREDAGNDLAALCEALELGLRAVEVMAIHKLMAVKDNSGGTKDGEEERNKMGGTTSRAIAVVSTATSHLIVISKMPPVINVVRLDIWQEHICNRDASLSRNEV